MERMAAAAAYTAVQLVLDSSRRELEALLERLEPFVTAEQRESVSLVDAATPLSTDDLARMRDCCEYIVEHWDAVRADNRDELTEVEIDNWRQWTERAVEELGALIESLAPFEVRTPPSPFGH